MERVHGEPLVSYGERCRLPVRERVALFIRVCQAVQHAHQKGIVHRDLKPSNILVSDGDAGPVPKVIDFGIAKAIAGDGETAVSRLTRGEQPLGTPAYMSPEQAGASADIDTRSDIYTLGVILYEVLTGVLPVDPRDTGETIYLSKLAAGELTLPRPGTRMRAGERLPADLDWIVLKALEHDRTRRYETVAAFAEDLGRTLRNEPVTARPPSVPYRVAKFVRRHRLETAAAVALLASIGVGLLAVSRQARIAERRFEDARQLIRSVIFDIQPRLEAIPATLELRRTLVEQTMKYLEAVSADSAGNVPLLQELSGAYLQLARVQGDVSTSNLGNSSAADERYARARALMEQALHLEPANPSLLRDATLLHIRLATFQNGQGHSEAALETSRAALGYAERNVAARAGEFDARELRAGCFFTLGLNTPADQDTVRREYFEQALREYTALGTENPAREPVVRNAGILHRHLASFHHDKGRSAEAVAHARDALRVSDAFLEKRPNDTALQLEVATDANVLGMTLDASGARDEAPVSLERSIGLLTAIRTSEPNNARATILLGEARRFYAANRVAAADLPAARRQSEDALALFKSLAAQGSMLPVVRWRFASALATAGDVERAEGRAPRACEHYAQSRSLFAEADRTSPLADLVKREYERVMEALTECREPRVALSIGRSR
jgi:tetratricopeptide (TPR) repeat protein